MGIIDPYINERFKYLLFKVGFFKNGVSLSEIWSPSRVINQDFIDRISSSPGQFSIVFAKGKHIDGQLEYNVEIALTDILDCEYPLMGYCGLDEDGEPKCSWFLDMAGYGKLWYIKKND